jgi:hypothetical protein
MRQLATNKSLNDKHAEKIEELNVTIKAARERQYEQLDGVRQAQIMREQEVAQTLKEYGKSVVSAIDQTTFIARELRRNHGENQ